MQVHITVIDMSGKKVQDITDRLLPAGMHRVEVPAKGLKNGVYLLNVVTANGTETIKMVVKH
jgi:hypothetical protein